MRRDVIEEKLGRAFDGAAPDILDDLLSDCEAQKGKVIIMTQKKKMNRTLKRAISLAAALALVLGCIVGVRAYSASNRVASTVSLDVNPSIEIKVNQKDKVLSVDARNEDARTVLGDMDFAGSSLDVTVNALIGSMVRCGYLSELANSILVSVDSGDTQRSQALQARLSEEIGALLRTDAFTGAVLSQTVAADSELRTLADTYGITVGKAQLIRQLVGEKPTYTFEELASLSINELKLLCGSGNKAPAGVSCIGAASDKAYIGAEAAKQAAFAAAGVAAADASQVEAELDCERGVIVYEVEFTAGGRTYDYNVNALTGELVAEADGAGDQNRYGWDDGDGTGNQNRYGWDDSEDDADDPDDDTAGGCGAGQAGSAGGVCDGTGSDASPNGANAQNRIQNGAQNGAGQAAGWIGRERAVSLALACAGIAPSDAADIDAELDDDSFPAVYEIDFTAGGYAYSCELDAVTGEVLLSEREADN